jgi:hypothetical protein
VIRADEQTHLAFVSTERSGYYTRRNLARKQPDRFMSLIIDGADQSRFHIPHWRELAHDVMSAYRIKLHLMGALSHGRKAFAYTVLPSVKQGSNATIDVLHRVIEDTYTTEGRLPPVLMLQLDNTTKQCKNKFILGFVGYLVHHRIFSDALLSFLPVGHTHEDIDQFFSRTSTALLQADAPSRIAVGDIVTESFRFEPQATNGGSVPVVGHLDTLANISGWLDERTEKFPGITKYNQFRLFAQNTPGGRREVRVAARLPSAKAVEAYDLDFHGLTDWAASSKVFNDDDLTRDFLDAEPFPSRFPVPVAQLAEPARYDQDKEREMRDEGRLRRDVMATMDKRGTSKAHRDDNIAVLDQLEAKHALPFNWNTQLYRDIASAASETAKGVGVGLVPGAEAAHVEPKYTYKAEDIVMIRLPDDAYPDEPVALARVRKTGLQKEDDGKEWPVYGVAYFTCSDPNEWTDNTKRKYSMPPKAATDWVYATSVLGTVTCNKPVARRRTLPKRMLEKLAYHHQRVRNPDQGQSDVLTTVTRAEVSGAAELRDAKDKVAAAKKLKRIRLLDYDIDPNY